MMPESSIFSDSMAKHSPPSREDFEHWLAYMPDALRHFLNALPETVRRKLDYSPASLDALEEWLLDLYPSGQSMVPQEEAARVGGSARYVGETFRRAAGGKWDLRIDDPQFAYYGMPILTDIGDPPICPLTLVYTAADRRLGNFMRTVLENVMNRPNRNIN
jgi:hypothetical protein